MKPRLGFGSVIQPLSMLLLFLVAQIEAHAAGFDNSYRVYKGDLSPADGLLDLYIRGTGAIPIMVDDLSVVIPPSVNDFALRNNGNGTFQVITSLTSAQRSAARAWPSASVGRSLHDVDRNGAVDLTLTDVSSAIGGAFDQTIFAAWQRGRAPLQLTAHGAHYQTYYRDMGRWLLNPAYFTNAPLRVVSAQPPTPIWFASTPDPSDYGTLFGLIGLCQQRYPNAPCGYTAIDPSPNARDPKGCTRTVNLLDPTTLTVVGTTTANVCEHDAHVYVYLPGTVTLEPDESVFNADAKRSADILDDFRETCASVPDPKAQELGTILTGVYGANLWEDQGRGPANNINSFPHAAFPGDDAFNPNDLTFHHYDVVTEMCNSITAQCDTGHLQDLLRWYSVPSFQLQPTYTQVDYVQRVMAYAALVPLGRIATIVPIGHIKQRHVTPPFGAGAVQNVTQDNHLVFPGTITRLVRQEGQWVDVVTHGIGINRAFCTLYSPKIPVQVITAWTNDVFGAEAFKTLDREMKKYYDAHPLGLPTGSSGPGSSKPGFDILGHPAVLVAPPES